MRKIQQDFNTITHDLCMDHDTHGYGCMHPQKKTTLAGEFAHKN
jgi:hypothetical protein